MSHDYWKGPSWEEAWKNSALAAEGARRPDPLAGAIFVPESRGVFPATLGDLVATETAPPRFELTVTINGFTFDESPLDTWMRTYDRLVGGGTRARRRHLAKLRAHLRVPLSSSRK